MRKHIFTFLFSIISCTFTYAQNVSFGHPGSHISRKLIKADKQKFEKFYDQLHDNVLDPAHIADAKKTLKSLGYDDSRVSVGDASYLEQIKSRMYRPNVLTRASLREMINNMKDSLGMKIMLIRSQTQSNVLQVYRTGKNADTLVLQGNALLAIADSASENMESSFRSLKILLRRNVNTRDFFPAKYSPEAIKFFTSSDTLASKFFSDNSLMFSSSQQKLTYGSEAYCDYFGPIRVGIGFAISSSSNEADTSEAQNDAVHKIATNGGNLNYSLSYPLAGFGNGSSFAFKAYLSTKGGVDIPKDSASASTYGFLTSSGLVMNLFSKGYMNVMQVFLTSRISYVFGNQNFENHLQQNNFWLWQNSFGIAIKDKFRVRVDFYNGLSGKANAAFVQSNFPATLSFDIVNPF